jgi:short-subunit dehydrogenase
LITVEIKDKVIIITGASYGIGLAAAKLLAEQGAKLVLSARSAEVLAKLEKELPNAFAVPADMRKPSDINSLISKSLEHFGRIDILVNNAGQAVYGAVEQVNINDYKQVIELNVYGPLLAMQAVIPVMRAQGAGMIINVSSMVSKNYFPYLGGYASTKYALNALSLTARQELAKDGIIVSVMHPKMTATDFGKNAVGQRPDFGHRPANAALQIDTPEAVAEKIAQLIGTEEAEAMM